MNSFFRLKPQLKIFGSSGKTNSCSKCGVISIAEKCQTCLMLEKLGMQAHYIKTEIGKKAFTTNQTAII
ncbi:MAG: hypothetical protein Q7K42_06370, partial [Candidatus Diapherotrites archaeon]|nr:hypothetical protein [Candidatus Diapherotrites archaeon]